MTKLYKTSYEFKPGEEIWWACGVPKDEVDVSYCILKVRVLRANIKIIRAGTELKYKLRDINTKGAHQDVKGLVDKNLFRTKAQAAAHLMKKIEKKIEKLNRRHYDASAHLNNIFDKLGSL